MKTSLNSTLINMPLLLKVWFSVAFLKFLPLTLIRKINKNSSKLVYENKKKIQNEWVLGICGVRTSALNQVYFKTLRIMIAPVLDT